MISNALIKHIRSLHQSKFRDEYNQFIAEGIKVVGELLNSDHKPIYICASCEWISDHANKYDLKGVTPVTCSIDKLERITALSTPNNVLAVFQRKDVDELPDLDPDRLYLFLDKLRDPGNLGTIIRIADWFGIADVFCTPDTVDIYNPKSVQAAMGSIARVKVHYGGHNQLFAKLPEGMQTFATDLDGENIYTVDLPEGGVIIIGSESHGITDGLLPANTRKLYIPAFGEQGHAESLNASVAAGIVCSEFRRRIRTGRS